MTKGVPLDGNIKMSIQLYRGNPITYELPARYGQSRGKSSELYRSDPVETMKLIVTEGVKLFAYEQIHTLV